MEKIGKLLMVVVLFGFHAFGCDKDEMDALLEVKAAMNYPNGNGLSDWTRHDPAGRPSDCCTDWGDDIACGANGRVKGLYLEQVRQVAQGDWYLNASLFLPFPELRTLDLSYNFITGWTRHLTQLSSLQHLNLGYNKLTGMIDVCDIEALGNLQRLEIGGNSIDGFKRCQEKRSRPSKLEELILKETTFSDVNTFLDSLSLFPPLKSLYLRGINLTGLIMTPGWLYQLRSIQVLDISETSLQGQFPLWLKNLTYLQNLDLSENNLQGKLPLFLANLTSLQYLELSSNQFVGSVENSPLTKLTSLTAVSLSSNMFQIPQSFKSFANHSHLKILWLDGNNLIPDNATHQHFVPKFQLSLLSLSNCNIVANLPYFLLSQYNLSYLDLSHNYIKGSFPFWIVENNTALELVTLYDNLLDSIHMPSHIHHHLIQLDLAYNNFNHLPTGLRHLTALRILLLNNNNFSGIIPSSLISSSLRVIDLSNNHLGGHIPSNICNLTFLSLSNNSIVGSLPPCFNDSSLQYVFLNKNKLNGSLLPAVFKKDNSLMILDLGSNQLSGVIPEWIGDLPNLSILILSDNYFESYIPNQICSLDQLSILDLSYNNLYGRIPDCLSQITLQSTKKKSLFLEEGAFLQLIDVHNLFSGEFFHNFFEIYSSLAIYNELDITTKSHTYTYTGEDLDGMSTIDLSCNNLSGHIPLEIGRMTGIRGLNLSHNKLIGLIPSTFSNLSQIESLDLSYNNLSGNIPPQLTQLNTLEFFSVAHNNLSGRTPDQKAQFGTFDGSSYQGNPYLCGPPLLNDYCSTPILSTPKNRIMEDEDGSMDMYVFYISFTVSSVIMFVGTLIVLYVNPHWRRGWFYYGEMWITCVYYFIVDSTRKAIKSSVGAVSRLIRGH